jgi:LacI family transcriptional regulator
MPHRRKVALLIETSNAYGRELLQGIRSWLREGGAWSIRLSEHGRGATVPSWLRGWKGDGVIARVDTRRVATSLRATGLPVVDVSAALEAPAFPRVVTDSRAVTRLALEHLKERGFRSFGYCGDRRFTWSVQRARFFAEHVRAETGAALTVYEDALGDEASADAEREVGAIARWLKGLPKPVGVLACYDVRGQQVLAACQEAGLAVPEDVAVIGVHNDELLCDLCEPPLTSVIPNARRAGYEAALLLERMMKGERLPVAVRWIEPLGVALRQSTDVVAVGDAKVSAAVRYIRDHAAEGIDVTDVLRAVPMSRTLLERKFKTLLGQTPHEHILRTRLARVRAMLAGTDLSVALIADRTGFEHAEYLSVAFRRETGMTPTAWRAQHRVGAPG